MLTVKFVKWLPHWLYSIFIQIFCNGCVYLTETELITEIFRTTMVINTLLMKQKL